MLFRSEEIFSSAYASAAYLKNILKLPADKKVYVIGEKGIEDELDALGIKHSGGTVRPPAWEALSAADPHMSRTRTTTCSST